MAEAGGKSKELTILLKNALYAEIYSTTRAIVMRYWKDKDVADDLAQQATIKAARKLERADPSLDLTRSLTPWLFSLVGSGLKDLLRKESRELKKGTRYENRRVAKGHMKDNPLLHVEGLEFAEALAHAVDALPERRRRVWLMVDNDDASYAEVAAALGISVKTVNTHLSRVADTLRKVRDWYQREGL